MYKIDYQNKEVTIEAVDKIYWIIADYDEDEIEVEVVIPFDRLWIVADNVLQYHNKNVSCFQFFEKNKKTTDVYQVAGGTEFINKMYKDFKKIKNKGAVTSGRMA